MDYFSGEPKAKAAVVPNDWTPLPEAVSQDDWDKLYPDEKDFLREEAPQAKEIFVRRGDSGYDYIRTIVARMIEFENPVEAALKRVQGRPGGLVMLFMTAKKLLDFEEGELRKFRGELMRLSKWKRDAATLVYDGTLAFAKTMRQAADIERDSRDDLREGKRLKRS